MCERVRSERQKGAKDKVRAYEINDMCQKFLLKLSCQHQTPGWALLCERFPTTENCIGF